MKVKLKKNKVIAILLLIVLLSIIFVSLIIKKNKYQLYNGDIEIESLPLSDSNVQDYLIDTLYSGMDSNFSSDDFEIDSITTTYISKEYIDELTYNSKSNAYFGYDLNELGNKFNGKKFVFTVGDDNQTIVKEFEEYDDTYIKSLKNVAVGAGVIVSFITVSVLSQGTSVAAIFMVGAETGLKVGVSSGLVTGILSGAVEYYDTGDVSQALKKGTLEASESFKWGAILGSVEGSILETTKQISAANELKKMDFKDIGSRAEARALKKYGGKEQVAFLNGKEVPFDTKYSTRPDILRDYKGHKEAIEVKNYNLNLESSRYRLVRELNRQITNRVDNLPKGYKQRIVLDVQGRNYDKRLLKGVVKEIKESLNERSKQFKFDLNGSKMFVRFS